MLTFPPMVLRSRFQYCLQVTPFSKFTSLLRKELAKPFTMNIMKYQLNISLCTSYITLHNHIHAICTVPVHRTWTGCMVHWQWGMRHSKNYVTTILHFHVSVFSLVVCGLLINPEELISQVLTCLPSICGLQKLLHCSVNREYPQCLTQMKLGRSVEWVTGSLIYICWLLYLDIVLINYFGMLVTEELLTECSWNMTLRYHFDRVISDCLQRVHSSIKFLFAYD